MVFGVNHTPTVHAWSGIDLASAVSCNAVLDPAPRFVGVVLEAKPDEVVPAIERARFGSTKMYHDALRQRWVGQESRVLVWHQVRYAKLYCMGYRRSLRLL